jgi:protein-tyrosine-phosphatase
MSVIRSVDVAYGSDTTLKRVEAAAARMGASVRASRSGDDVTAIAGLDVPDDAPEWWIEAAILRALEPGHVLFLCVANSARSQLAEGLARSLAPEGVKVSSAGSVPTRVRPQAIAALAEIGLDISGHRSTGIDEVERPVDAVITLCAEEVCPVWLEKAWRLHWGLPDPAGSSDDPDEEMEAFRAVRDELRHRFGVLFG